MVGFRLDFKSFWLLSSLLLSGCSGCVHTKQTAVHHVDVHLPQQAQSLKLPAAKAWRTWSIANINTNKHLRWTSKPKPNSAAMSVHLRKVDVKGDQWRVSTYIPYSKECQQCCWGHVDISNQNLSEPLDALKQSVQLASNQLHVTNRCLANASEKVKKMIDATHSGKGQVFLLQTIRDVANIGGTQAAGWLFVLSQGHEQKAVRQASEEALQQVIATLPNPFS